MTKRISEELSEDHLLYILHYLDQHEGQLEDYLQVFEFYIERDQQWLIQRQEVPERETTIFAGQGVTKLIERIVWVMDQQDHIMILFPEDYKTISFKYIP
jgi:hypothetical protein